MGWLFVLSKIG